MTFVAAAIGGLAGAAGIGGLTLGSGALLGGVVGAGLSSSRAAGKAADAQAQAAQDAAALEYQMFQENKDLNKPFYDNSLVAQNRMMDLLGLSKNTGADKYGYLTQPFNANQMYQDPGYQFRLSEGLKSMDRQAAAQGGLQSGGALKAAQRYGQDYASNEFNNAFNRYQTERSALLNPLQSLTGAGQTVAQNLGQAGQNYANQAGELYTQAGNARASGYIGKANAMSDMVGNAMGMYGSANGWFGKRG
jgi:hypothetical protein